MSALDAAQAAFLVVHQRLYEATGGRIGHRLIGVPTLLLRTTGRKTGLPRTSALVYAVDSGDYVVVASNGGSDTAPGWLANVRGNRDVGLQVARRTLRATAVVVERGDAEYERLWRIVNANNHARYDGYQARTSRPIALVRLTPSP
ncbi:MAG TPA: nitroreductase family deazaflavin-dependent oxidoreductase [Acidimicrobiales bacterium]|nr:nitroreductase family deazaflavin-dependent oxidoreductase [Acidimicrobiales bacterium]